MWESIQTPTLVLDERRARRHIARMAQKAERSGVRLRPHFKTHQSAAVGDWFRAAGVEAITVSSLAMARHFADAGWTDITVAFPVNVRELEAIGALARRARLGLLVESPEVVALLAARLSEAVALWIKVDTGYGRTGVPAERRPDVVALARQIQAAGLRLAGLLTHAGHAYAARGRGQIEAIHRDTVAKLGALRDALTAAGVRDVALSVGDTPTCSVVEDFGGVDEIRPGNFVFYDLMQLEIGACREEDLALALACPVVARHPERGELVLYGGAVHLSKECLAGEDGRRVYGRVALPGDDGWEAMVPDAHVASLSQEHGIVKSEALAGQVQVGDLLLVLPVHACLAADLMRAYRMLDGETLAAGGF